MEVVVSPRPQQQSLVVAEPEGAEERPPSHGPETRGALARIGGFCARRPVLVISVWLLVLAGALVGRHFAAPVFSDQITLSGTQSKTGGDLLAKSEPRAGDPSGKVVFHVDSGS